MRKWLFYSFLMAFTWLFVNASISVLTFIQGLLISLPIAFVFRRFYPGEFNLESLRRIPFCIIYIGSFLNELLVSNLDAAYRVLSPSMPIDPKFIHYKTDLNHPTAITILANSITLTPGTLVVDFDEENKELKIHCLSGTPEEAKQGIQKWEKILKKIFGDSR